MQGGCHAWDMLANAILLVLELQSCHATVCQTLTAYAYMSSIDMTPADADVVIITIINTRSSQG